MPILAKDIPGFMIEKKKESYYHGDIILGMETNQAIDQQGSKKLGLNRERLSKLMAKAWRK